MKPQKPIIYLTQKEADLLLSLEKHYLGNQKFLVAGNRSVINIPLISANRREEFFLDIRHGRIGISRVTFQNRARKTVSLARIDMSGPPHRNPNEEIIPCPHLHLYREGSEDKWAFPLPSDTFKDTSDPWSILDEFMTYCNIITRPEIGRGLFI